MIYGVTGSGKSTFAAKLSELTGIPWHSVDDLTFKPGNWENLPTDEQREIFTELCAGDRWILDTAYGAWRDIPLARVETVIGLDYPRTLSLWRLARRTLSRVVTGNPICNGNRETLRQALSRNSIIAWHFKSYRSKRDRIRTWQSGSFPFKVIVFNRPRLAERWLTQTFSPEPKTR